MSFDFEPIDHKNTTFLNQSLNEAREDIKSGDRQKEITAVLTLSNQTEYLVKDLIRNLRRMIKGATYQNFNGVIFWPSHDEESDLGKTTLGQLVRKLEEFNFPDKESLVKYLSSFNENRIKLIHKLLDEAPSKELINAIADDFENIFTRYKTIQKELVQKWPHKKG